MLRMLFTINKDIIIFDIDNKNIIYRDRKWPNGVRFIPKDADFVKQIIFSRNRISGQLINWINEANSGKSFAEWESCKDDFEVAEIVKRDARSRGCVFQNMFTAEQLKEAENQKDAMLEKIPIQQVAENAITGSEAQEEKVI